MSELLERIGGDRVDPAALTEWLLESVGPAGERREQVADAISIAARELTPAAEPPSEPSAAPGWNALVAVADLLSGSGVHELGRLPFLGDRILNALVAESRAERPDGPATGRRTVARAGGVLAGLAVSRQLRGALGDALGFAVVPTYDAIYLYEPPGSHVRTHVDARDYEIVFHLILEHELPANGSAGSALIVHLPRERKPTRVRLRPGEGVALRGRGTIHSWEPLEDGERRTLTAVGFERATVASEQDPRQERSLDSDS